MRRCIIIDVERMQDNKVEKVYQKLKNKYGNLVTLYNEYDELQLCCHALDLLQYTTWEEVNERINNKYINKSGGV